MLSPPLNPGEPKNNFIKDDITQSKQLRIFYQICCARTVLVVVVEYLGSFGQQAFFRRDDFQRSWRAILCLLA